MFNYLYKYIYIYIYICIYTITYTKIMFNYVKLLPENRIMMFNNIYHMQFNFLHNIFFDVCMLYLNKKNLIYD